MHVELPRLEKYALLEPLASGGTGEVFLAQRRGAFELCVVKLPHAYRALDEIARGRLLREAQVASLLIHPRIAHLIDAGYERDTFYLAMEYVPGQEISALLAALAETGRRLPLELGIAIGLRVLEGLEYAHGLRGPQGEALELVHRDLSPRNVMISFSGEVKIIDFGVARASIGRFRTEPGVVLGTPSYMSPEQANGEEVDWRSDLYSWSAVTFELLSGRRLVNGRQMWDVLRLITVEPSPVLSSIDPKLPRGLDAVFERALAKDRAVRFQSARELAAALVAVVGAIDLSRAEASLGALLGELFAERRARTLELIESVGVADLPPLLATRAEARMVTSPVVPVAQSAVLRAPRSRLVFPVLLLTLAVAIVAGAVVRRRAPEEVILLAEPPTAQPAITPRAREQIAAEKKTELDPAPEPKPRTKTTRPPPPRETTPPPATDLKPAATRPPPSSSLDRIRAQIEAGDPRSLEQAAEMMQREAEKLGATPERDAVLRCLDRRVTAPDAAVMRETLTSCLTRLDAALKK